MSSPKIVSREDWLAARKALLAKEKAFSKERDAISKARRELGMVLVENPYTFDSPGGKQTLRDLFGDRRQLVVYHFMLDPKWEAGCKSCSLIADHLEPSRVHLRARDIALAAVSRAPIANIERYEKRMGWTFPWVSSFESDFNHDFGVTFRAGEKGYNYSDQTWEGEAPGMSCFFRDGDRVFHTYSTYGRGLDILIGAYNVIDHTPLGRQEEGQPHGMMWVKRHDEYEA